MNIKKLIENAEAGDMRAQSSLACLYHEGDGVPQDDEKAFYWFSLAAEKGHAFAQNYLGMMYLDGRGVDEDFEEAFIWFLIASNSSLSCCYDAKKGLGNPYAQCNLALMYIEGNGVPESLERAAHWANLAYRQDSEFAAELIDEYELRDYIWQHKI